MAKNPIKFTDTTFRDAHQSLMATRLRTEDLEPIAADMDAIGFHSMEVWGGATFDSATRFLGEDPWERLRTFKRLVPNTPLTMLLRGQTLVGYRTYADDVVDAFVERAAENGIDQFRVFDALNDERNLERAAQAVKAAGKHLQLAVCYSVTESGRLGGPIYDLDYFVGKLKTFLDMGADSLCLKDMAGLLAPYDAETLVKAIKAATDVPLQLHTHYTSGMASMTTLKAIEAGVDIVDVCLAPLALRTSQPAVEPLVVSLAGGERESGLDLDALLRAGDYMESMLSKYRDLMDSPRAAVIDAKVLSHQIPGGMASNLIAQLREADALDRLDEVLAEIPRTRKELGYPPLVTPMSQITGSQAVTNVLMGRYAMISGQVKDYVYGLYGTPPAPIDPELVATALKDYERGQKRFKGRPADLVEPEMDSAREATKDITDDVEDVLIYALYPTTGLKFLRIKYGIEPMPEEMKPRGPMAAEAASSKAPVRAEAAPPKSPNARRFNVYVEDEFFQVEVDPVGDTVGLSVAPAVRPAVPATPSAQPAAAPAPSPSVPEVVAGQEEILAPMPGIVLKYLVEVGQSVEPGTPVVVLEAMKMENTMPSPVAGTVTALPRQIGETVAKDDVLAIIAP